MGEGWETLKFWRFTKTSRVLKEGGGGGSQKNNIKGVDC